MLYIDNLSLQFNDVPLLTRFSLHVAQGEMVCIAGSSGCGKSSLLKAVMGFVPLTCGSVRVNGIELLAKTAESVRRNIAYLPQELSFPCEWVHEMIDLPFKLKANRKSEPIREQMHEYFILLGLEKELFAKRVGEISGGQRQRIMLAVSGMLGKKLLLVDEPTSALDAGNSEQVLSFFNSLTKQGVSVLVVSHDKAFATGCDRIIDLTKESNGND